jgi:hypothetical protein
MNKKLLTLILTVGIFVIFIATGLQAGTEVADEIVMDYNKYTKRKYTPPKYEVYVFTHERHFEEYDISCGECHHDKEGNPLKDLKTGDDVQQCVECHTELKKTKKNKKSILLLENAIHTNCKVCHKRINIENGDPKGRKGPAPVACKECHVKVEGKK